MGDFDFNEGLDRFTKAVQQVQLNRSLQAANEQVHQIRESELADADQTKAIRGVANDLTLKLVGMGANDQAINQVKSAFAPPDQAFQQQVYLKMLDVKAAQENRAGDHEFQKSLKDSDHTFQAGQNALNRNNQLAVADAKKKPDKIPLPAIKEITGYDNQLSGLSALESMLKNVEPGIANKLNTVEALKRMNDPAYQSFATEVQQYTDAYRKAITGMSATEGELKMIMRNMPNVSDTPSQFRAKLKTLRDVGGRVRKNYLNNMKKGGYDVDAFMKEGSAADAASPEMQAAFNTPSPTPAAAGAPNAPAATQQAPAGPAWSKYVKPTGAPAPEATPTSAPGARSPSASSAPPLPGAYAGVAGEFGQMAASAGGVTRDLFSKAVDAFSMRNFGPKK